MVVNINKKDIEKVLPKPSFKLKKGYPSKGMRVRMFLGEFHEVEGIVTCEKPLTIVIIQK